MHRVSAVLKIRENLENSGNFYLVREIRENSRNSEENIIKSGNFVNS